MTWAKRLSFAPRPRQTVTLRDLSVASRCFAVSSGDRRGCPSDSERGGGRGFSVFLSSFIILFQEARGQWINRSLFHIYTCGRRLIGILGVERVEAQAVAILDQSDVVSGEVSASNSDHGLAISNGGVRSLNPCGLRMRDESTKRNRA